MLKTPLLVFIPCLLWGAPIELRFVDAYASWDSAGTSSFFARGLSASGPPSVGAFDVTVALAFDPGFPFGVNGVTFSPALGDPNAGEVLTSWSWPNQNELHLSAISLLSPAALDALQPANNVPLAAIHFLFGHAVGTILLDVSSATVSDAFGNPLDLAPVQGTLIVVPEPAGTVLGSVGLALLLLLRARGKRHRVRQ